MELAVSWQTISPERTPKKPPVIKPTFEINRPRWSVMIPVYNSSGYLEQTLISVLSQALSDREMQIEVVDDCSTDIDVQEVVCRVGKGRIHYYRQPYNVGSLRNFETCLNLSKGHYIHLLHSDDLVHDGFYNELDTLFNTYSDIGAAFCRSKYIDENGLITHIQEVEAPVECVMENWLLRLAEKQRIPYASIAVKREVYETLGGFYGVHYSEQWEMWARIATRYTFGYTPAALASSRVHPDSISARSFETAQNLKDLEFVIQKINSYLPSDLKENVLKNSRRFYAYHALSTAELLWNKSKHSKGTMAQIRRGWSMHKDIKLAYKMLMLIGRMLFNR